MLLNYFQLYQLPPAIVTPPLVNRHRAPSGVWLISRGFDPGDILWVAGNSDRLQLARKHLQSVALYWRGQCREFFRIRRLGHRDWREEASRLQ